MSVWNAPAWREWRARHPNLSLAVYSIAAVAILAAVSVAVGLLVWIAGLVPQVSAGKVLGHYYECDTRTGVACPLPTKVNVERTEAVEPV